MTHAAPLYQQAPALCAVSRECGGCPWIERPIEGQHTAKLAGLCAALESHEVAYPEPDLVSAGAHLGYRNRLRLRVDERGAAVFFNPQKLVSCAVLAPALAEAVQLLQGLGPLAALADVEHLELRVGDDDGVGLCAYRPAVSAVGTGEALQAALPAAWRVAVVDDLPSARLAETSLKYYLEEALGAGLSYQVPLSSFVQVNSAVNRALVAEVRRLVRGAGLHTFNDLFCGAGNFSLPLLLDGLSGESFELDPLAIAALTHGAQRFTEAGREHRARVADARALGPALVPRDLLLANPPRAGLKLDEDSARLLAGRATRYIGLCSCSPQSLARDLSLLLPHGFELRALRAFDMFPHTRHLETLAWLERR